VKPALIAFLLIGVIALSGCIGGGGEVRINENNGLIITEFNANPTAIEDTEDILFTVDIENQGGTTATGAEVKIYGAEGWCGTTSKAWTSLDPPDPVTNTMGDAKTFSSLLSPPDIPEGVSSNFPITARATFTYHTTGTITIPAYSKTLDRINQETGNADATINVDNTYAPIQIGLNKGSIPLVIDEDENEDVTYILDFINVGSGWPVTESTGGTTTIGRMQGTIKLLGNGMTLTECLNENADGNEVSFDDVDTLRLRSGGRVPISCSFDIDSTVWDSTTSGSVIFVIDVDYTYYVESTSTVTVHGTDTVVSCVADDDDDEDE